MLTVFLVITVTRSWKINGQKLIPYFAIKKIRTIGIQCLSRPESFIDHHIFHSLRKYFFSHHRSAFWAVKYVQSKSLHILATGSVTFAQSFYTATPLLQKPVAAPGLLDEFFSNLKAQSTSSVLIQLRLPSVSSRVEPDQLQLQALDSLLLLQATECWGSTPLQLLCLLLCSAAYTQQSQKQPAWQKGAIRKGKRFLTHIRRFQDHREKLHQGGISHKRSLPSLSQSLNEV